jgi:hypothetical protein
MTYISWRNHSSMSPLTFDNLGAYEKVSYTRKQGQYLVTCFSDMIFRTLYYVDGFFVEIASDATSGTAVEIISFNDCTSRIDLYVQSIDLAELV